MTSPTQNPLLERLAGPLGAIPFDRIVPEDFIPAFEFSFQEARDRVAKLKRATDISFEAVFEGLEAVTERLDYVSSLFHHFSYAHSSPSYQEIGVQYLPKLANFGNEIGHDKELFAIVKKAYEAGDWKKKGKEQQELVERTYRSFVLNGALLSEEAKHQLQEIDERMALLSHEFREHLLKATKSVFLTLENAADTQGLPAFFLEAAAHEAETRGLKGQWVITLDGPSYVFFMKYSERRDLRERLWRQYNGLAVQGEFSNQKVLLEMVQTRQKRAALLGFRSHADLTLQDRMAQTPEKVDEFLQLILQRSLPAAKRDLEEVRTFSGLGQELKAWDLPFYSERLKEQKLQFDEQQLRPYLALDSVLSGVFTHTEKLYGLEWIERKDLPVYHPDVKIFEVRDRESGKWIGVLHVDLFVRESKKGGAWMKTLYFPTPGLGEKLRPHLAVVCNFMKPAPGKPTLLSFTDVRTLFHEFGHALHFMLCQCRYRSTSEVYWDFVELPSQIMENWVYEKESIAIYGRHHETGQPLPEAWIERLKDERRFQAGWMSLRQAGLSLLDMAWHHPKQIDAITSVEAYENQVLAPTRLLAAIPGTMISCAFAHIFAGGYSAGYYSYKWAEVLDADAFEAFREQGIFDRKTALKFRQEVLEKGGSEPPDVLYRRFRGRDPDPEALFRRSGLI